MTVKIDGNVVKLYGTIWWGDGPWVQNQIEPVLAEYDEVIVRLHTPGGSVTDGNLIYNALKNSDAKITTIIDGLCASMGTILMLAGDIIKMAENAFVMIHAPFGWVEGTAADLRNYAKLLESTEKNFIKKYAAKTGRDPKELATWMQGDNWFSAEEAEAEGLIDEILDASMDDLDINTSGKFTYAAVAGMFKEYDVRGSGVLHPMQASTESTQTQKDNEMKISAKNLTVLGLEADASDRQINAAIEAIAKKAEDAEAKATASEDKAKVLQDKLDAQEETQINGLVDTAVTEGRIGADEKEEYIELAKSNFSLAQKTIAKLPAKKSLAGAAQETGKGGSVQGRDDWDFDKWRKEDPKGLIEMSKKDPEAYAKLLGK